MRTASNSRVLRTIPLLIAVWIFYGGLPVRAQAEIVYEVIDLGTLNGDWSEARSIDDPGQIVGRTTDAIGSQV